MQIKGRPVMVGAITALLWLPVVSLLLVTNPARIGPIGVTIWFLLLWAALTGTIASVLYFIKGRMKLHESDRTRLNYSLRQGFLIAAVFVVWLALVSLRQLSGRDVLLTAILAGLIEFYFRARRTS